MKRLLILFSVLITTLCLSKTALAESSATVLSSIGKVVLATGNTKIIRGEQTLPAKRNLPLYENDILLTGKKSKLLLRLTDKTTVSLAEETEFALSKYRYTAKTSDVSFKMLKGAFRTVTGDIGKQATPLFEIETPVATIGIRGTDYWGGFIFSDALDVAMFKGKGVYVKNASGEVELASPEYGTTVQMGQTPSAPIKWPDTKINAAILSTAIEETQGY